MKLGFFIMPVHPLTRRYAETLREDREAFVLADKLGYSEGYCGEHLTDLAENIPSSLMFCASLAGFTSKIKLGTAVVNLPFLSEKAKHNILGGTAARLFKLPPRNEKQKANLQKFGNLHANAA